MRNPSQTSLAVSSFELLHSPIQSMLHHVTHIHITLPNLCVPHGQHSLDILQGKPVPLNTLKGLGTTNECLDIFGINLKDGRTILNDTIEIGNLFVACGSVGVGLDGEVGLGLATALETLEAFGVVIDGS